MNKKTNPSSGIEPFDAFREYRSEADFEPDAAYAYRIIRFIRIIGWVFLVALLAATTGVVVWDKFLRPLPSATKVEFHRVEPRRTDSLSDPIYRILSEQG